jgi:hypothetical protein
LLKKLHTYFSHTFGSSIWRILASDRWLVVENREGASRSVHFAAIDLPQAKLCWEGLVLPQPWWVGASIILGDTLLLQQFSDPQKPQTRGITGVDISSGKISWQQPAHSLLRLTDRGIIAFQESESGQVFGLLDPATGDTKTILETGEIDLLPYIPEPPVIHPVHYTHENKYFNSIVLFLRQKLGIEPQKAVDYAEFQQRIIISYYIYEHKNLSNFLLVLDKEANVVLHEQIASHLPGIGIDTFFIVQHYLIVVKDKKELTVYEL